MSLNKNTMFFPRLMPTDVLFPSAWWFKQMDPRQYNELVAPLCAL